MQILKIEIRAVGGLANLAIVFDPKMNIICGPNGVGKTTVLESIAHCFTLGSTTILKRHVRAENSEVTVSFRHLDKVEDATIKFRGYEPEAQEQLQGRYDLAPYLLTLKTARTFAYSPLSAVSRDAVKSNNVLWDEVRRGFSLQDIKNWFVNRYLYSAYEDSLSMEQRDNFELAKRCFSALDSKVSFLRVVAATNEMVVSTQSGDIYYEYLSSGFKSCLAMMLGIIKEIEIRFPEASSAQDFAGVVLIDEIELHLHPEWQARIVRVLTEIFPKIQFVVTTHSPHLIQSADPNQIIALELVDDEVALRPLPATKYGFKGWTLDEVLTDVMGMTDTRSAELLAQLDRFNRAIDQENRQKAELAFRDLDASLHPSNHTRKLLKLQLASLSDSTDDQA